VVEGIKNWIETEPYAVPIIAASLIVFFVIVKFIKTVIQRIFRSIFYEIAEELDLEIIADSGQSQSSVPRIAGFYQERSLEISGFKRPTSQGVMVDFVSIKMGHTAYLVRKVVIEYHPMKTPPLQKLTIDHKEHPPDSLLELEAFDETVLEEMEILLDKHSQGKALQNSILTFGIREASLDREISLIGNRQRFINCIEDLHKLLSYMEKITRS